jgi:hypothetical protein
MGGKTQAQVKDAECDIGDTGSSVALPTSGTQGCQYNGRHLRRANHAADEGS